MTDESNTTEEAFDNMLDASTLGSPAAMIIRGLSDLEPWAKEQVIRAAAEAMDAQSFAGRCRECGHVERWSTRHATGCAMTWHVFEQHPQLWQELIGTHDPLDPRPELVGTRVIVDHETGEL